MADVVLKRHCKLLSFFTIIIIIITEFLVRLLHVEHRCITVIKVYGLKTNRWKMLC